MPKGLGLTPKPSGPRPQGTTSTFAAGMMLLKAYLGSGLLAMPYGLQCGGLWGSIIALSVLASASNFTLKLFIKLKVATMEQRRQQQQAAGGGGGYHALGAGEGADAGGGGGGGGGGGAAGGGGSPPGRGASNSLLGDDALADMEQQDVTMTPTKGRLAKLRGGEAAGQHDIGGPVTLEHIGRYAYGRVGARCMQVVMVISNVGVAVSYILFVGDTLADLVTGGHDPADSNGWVVLVGGITVNYFTLMLVPPMAALSQLRDMSKLAFSSLLGNVALLVVILMVCYLSGGKIQSGVSYSGLKPSTFPLFFGITIFSFSMHGVILGIEDGMRHKEELPRTCNICAVVVTSIYSLFGAVGFAGYRR